LLRFAAVQPATPSRQRTHDEKQPLVMAGFDVLVRIVHFERDMPSESRRVLGRTTAMLLTAAMIIGTGLFAALGETIEKAGAGVLLAMLLSGVVALLTGLSAASVGINFPE